MCYHGSFASGYCFNYLDTTRIRHEQRGIFAPDAETHMGTDGQTIPGFALAILRPAVFRPWHLPAKVRAGPDQSFFIEKVRRRESESALNSLR